ncbi:MAG TPA: tetratricopeptide repeat protein [Thermoanaerobaculia bacterium]|jgi:Flp pilus assembly protein TadD
MKTILALLSLSLLAAPLAAQAPPPPAAARPAAPAAAAPASPLNAAVEQAINLVQAGNKTAAFARLKEIASDPAATQPELSTVGALFVEIGKPQEALKVLKPLADTEDAEPAVLYNAGRAALLAGQTDAGRIYLTRSVLKEPASPAARELGLLTAREGRVVEAYSMLRPWVLHNPTDAQARLMAASLAVQLERPDDAAQFLEGMPDDATIQLLNAKVRILRKDGPGAVALLKPLLAKHPQGMELEVRRSLAEADLLAGQPAEAAKLIEGRAAGHPALVLLLARAQRQAGNAAAAAATLKPLADKLPESASGLGDPRPAAGIAAEYGALLVDAGRAAEAVPFYEKATRYYPRNADAWKGLARAYEASGRKADAQRALAQATEVAKLPARPAGSAAEPSAAAVSAGSGSAPGMSGEPEQPLSPGLQNALELMTKGQLEPALTAVRQEIAVSKDPRARMIELRILLALKRPQEGIQSAEAALAADPNNPDYLYMRGVSEMAVQRFSSAEQDFRKALQIQPRHLPAMNDLAVLLIQVHKDKEARKLLEQVLQINPQDQMAAANLQQLKATMEGQQ